MSRPCTVCTHPKREEIDKLLVEGKLPNTTISSLFDVTEIALRRHRANHLPEKLVRAEGAREAAQAEDLLDQVKGLRNKTYGILLQAEKAGDLRVALSAIKEARACLELLAKLIGELDERPQVNVLLSPQWIQVRAVLLNALQPYPEARQAASLALLEVGDERSA